MLLHEFEQNLRIREVAENTIRTYLDTARRLTEYLKNEYNAEFERDNVTGLMISHWAGTIASLKPSTRKLYHLAAATYLSFLYESDCVSKDLTRALPDIGSLESLYKRHPELRPNKQPYTVNQVRQMLETPSRSREVTLRNHALVAVLVSTGLRIFEALQLNIADIYENDDVRVARKGTYGNRVSIVIPAQVRDYVDPYVNFRAQVKGEDICGDSPLFVGREGERIKVRGARAAIAELEKKLGLPTGLHTFRHTALSETSRVADPVVARDFAGQKNLTVTNRYLHSSEDDRRAAADKVAASFLNAEPKPAQPDLAAQLAAAQALVQQLQSLIAANSQTA